MKPTFAVLLSLVLVVTLASPALAATPGVWRPNYPSRCLMYRASPRLNFHP